MIKKPLKFLNLYIKYSTHLVNLICKNFRYLVDLSCYIPVQELPVLSSPAVLKFLSVHASDLIKIGFINTKQPKAIDLPVAYKWKRGTKEFITFVQLSSGVTSSECVHVWAESPAEIYSLVLVWITDILLSNHNLLMELSDLTSLQKAFIIEKCLAWKTELKLENTVNSV